MISGWQRSCAGKNLLAEFHRLVVFPERLHQRHLDPGSESSREGPPGAVPLTFSHKPWLILTRGPENRDCLNSPGPGFFCFFFNGESGKRIEGTICHAENLPAHQVTKISKDHVTDGAEVLPRFVGTKLHEDDFFASDCRWALDHQSSFLSVSR